MLIIAALLMALPVFAQAQDAPKAEIFGGYSYLRADDNVNGQDLNGFSTSVAVNFNKWFGIATDISGHYTDLTVSPGVSADLNAYIFTVGPRFSYRGYERVTPYGHIQFGAARSSVNFFGPTGRIRNSDSAFAMVVGGGLDVKIINSVSLRLFQADYVLTRFADDTQNNFRVSTGIVIKLGEQ